MRERNAPESWSRELGRRVFLALAFLVFATAPSYANWCGTPGKNGTATISGVVNTYYPATADASAGATSITLGASTGANTGIAAGDLLLVIQMQDATISTSNTSSYGDNTAGGGSGYSNINQAGRYEFVRATNTVGTGGGTVNIVGAAGAGLVNSYNYNAMNSTTLKQSFQVVRVPQYYDATVSGTITASPWDGTSGGIVALDVADRLTFSGGSISVSGMGFRGGGALQQSGGTGGTNTDYRTLASKAYNGAKGEGIAGTPRYVNNNGTLQDNSLEGYPNGSNARGAPGNAGGGGSDGNPAANDQNTGGGGGGNAGAGGQGGYAWCSAGPPNCAQTGGFGGAAVAERSVTRLAMGGGGGAATTNNATGTPGSGFASSGAAGGGIVFIRAAEIAGTGSIAADGADGNTTILNDGSGGGGAGGSVLIASIRSVAGALLTVSANGGDGGSNTGTGVAHGPGGGGGGGYVLSTATISVSASVSGGVAGTTQGGGSQGANYGAAGGSAGGTGTIAASSVAGMSSGGECTPTITKSFATSPITPGTTSRMSIAVVNNNPTTAMTSLAFTDSYPSGMVNTALPSASKTCATAGTLTASANGGSFAVSAATISAASNCTYSVNTTVSSNGDKTNTLAAGTISWAYGTTTQTSLVDVSAILSVSPPLTIVKSSTAYSDPVNGTTNPKQIPGSFVYYTVTVSNPGTYTVDNNSVVIVDATPANLQLYVNNIPGGTGPVLFQNGTPSSALTYTFTSLASTTDDVDFSNDNGATWTYTPTPNASGVDPNVTQMRIRPKGSMAAGSTFNLYFEYLVK